MEPIGAPQHWAGYRNNWIVLNGHAIQAVGSGGHWGGRMFIHAYDLARLGLLCLHDGRWEDQRCFLKLGLIKPAPLPQPVRPTDT